MKGFNHYLVDDGTPEILYLLSGVMDEVEQTFLNGPKLGPPTPPAPPRPQLHGPDSPAYGDNVRWSYTGDSLEFVSRDEFGDAEYVWIPRAEVPAMLAALGLNRIGETS